MVLLGRAGYPGHCSLFVSNIQNQNRINLSFFATRKHKSALFDDEGLTPAIANR
jgi:hypothetical protein